MSSYFSRSAGGLAVLCSMLAWSGCGLFGGGSSGSAQLRVLQASKSVPSADVVVDGTTVVSSMAYGANTGYLTVKSGTRHVQIVPTGSTTAIVDESINIAANGAATVVVNGVSPNIAALTLTDNHTAPATGTVQLRLINASTNMGPADVFVVPAGNSLTSGSPTVAGLQVGQVAGYQTLTIPSTQTSETFTVFFTRPGTTSVLVDSGPISLTPGQIRTLVALDLVGTNGGSTFTVLSDLN